MPDDGEQLDIFPIELDLRRVDDAGGVRRFYRLALQPDLFGGVGLLRESGRVGGPGRVRVDLHPDEGRAVSALWRIAGGRMRRGYRRVHREEAPRPFRGRR